MPVLWKRSSVRCSSTHGGLTPEAARDRIDAIVRYLEAIQQRVAQ